MMRGYCDTDTLFHNTKRHADQSEVKTELDALTVLLAKHRAGEITLFRSRVNLREVEATKDADQLSHLLAELRGSRARSRSMNGTTAIAMWW